MNVSRTMTLRMVCACAVLGVALVGCGNTPSAPLTAAIVSPDAAARLSVGQPTMIVARATGSGLKVVDLWVDGQKYAGVSQPNQNGEFVINAPWTPNSPNLHVLQVKGTNDKGEEIVKSDPVFLNVVGPTATPPPVATAAPAQPTSAPQPTAAPTAAGASVTPDGDFVNVRSGPGTTYNLLGQVKQGETSPVRGKSADGTWWQITFGTGTGWVFGQLVRFTGDANTVPVVQAPPPPVAQIVPTATPRPPAATPTSNLPASAFLPYSQVMRFSPRDDIGDVPLGMVPDTKTTTVLWRINGAKEAFIQIERPGSVPDIFDCPPGDLGSVFPGSLQQRAPISLPEGQLQFTITGKGYYLMTIFVTKADGSTTSIPRNIIVDCFKKPGS